MQSRFPFRDEPWDLAILYLLKNRWAIPWTWVLRAPWLALFLFHVLTYVEPRYLIPGRPGIAVLAALMLERLIAPAKKPVWETSSALAPGPEASLNQRNRV